MEDSGKGAKKVLAKSPDDPDANLDLGGFLCFQQDNWKEGLPHLAKAHDTLLKNVAELELSQPSTADGQFRAAEAWWNVAANRRLKELDPWFKGMRDRALYW